MSFQKRNLRVVNQEAVDTDLERLVRESPVPQMLFHDHNSSCSNSSFVIPGPRVGRPMSASAIPKMHVYATASPCAQFAPFRSPQSLNITFPSKNPYPSAASIFKSLKNQSHTDGDHSSLDTSQDNDYISKENNSAAANTASDREFQVVRGRHLQGLDGGRLFGREMYLENSRLAKDHKEVNQSHSTQSNRIHNRLVQGNGNIGQFGNGQSEILRGPIGELNYQVYSNQTGSNTHGKTDNCYEETFQEAFSDVYKDTGPCQDSIEACSLYMWIIKPVPGTHSICVEGKKSLEEDTFWHSGVITQRINEKLVETQTRSVYRLEGNMELLDAMAAGFSRKTAEAFWLGFPADWQQLIKDHFNTTQLNSISEESADSEEEITTLEADIEDSGDLDTGQDDTALTELVSTDAGEDELTTGENEDIHVEVIPSPADKKKVVTRKGSKAEVVIENWIIKLLPGGKGIHVLGTKPDSGLLWHSSAIEKRLDKKRLMSSSGSVYRLKGNLDRLLALNEGLPLQIIDKFSSGFPREWQELVQEFLSTEKGKKKKAAQTKLKKKKRVVERKEKDKKTNKDFDTDKKRIVNLETSKQGKSSKVKVITSRQKGQQVTDEGKKIKEKNRQKTLSTPIETCKWTKNVLTPNGEMVDLESLGRSRSGRLIKPPLQWWTGQTLELDGDTITVKAPTAAASMYLQDFEEGYKKSKRKVKSYWNPREKDKDYSLNTTKSSLSVSVSSVDTESESKQKNVNKSSSYNVDKTSQSSDVDLDSKLKLEVKLILEKAKSKRTKVSKRDTCYSGKNQDRKNPGESDNPFELNETSDLDKTTETEQELSDTEKQSVKSNRQEGKKTKATSKKPAKDKVEQVAVVSSSTGEVENENDNKTNAGEGIEESIADRTLRYRRIKTCESSGTNITSRINKKQECVESTKSFPQRRRRRVLTVIEEDEQDEEEETKEINTEIQKESKSKNLVTAKGKLASKRKSVKKDEVIDTVSKIEGPVDDHWTKEEKERLIEACKKVSPSNPHYWEKVATEVRTKSADLCKAMYYSDQKLPRSAEKKNKKNVKEKVKVTGLTANVGTLKRKQQLKDLLEQQNENYADDLFDSTPYRLTRKRKVPIIGDDDDDAIFEELARKQGKSRFETPVATDTVCSRITVPFASTKKTPVSNVNVDMLQGSGDTDGYVHKILKRRLLTKGKKKAVTPKQPKKVQEEISPQKKLLFHKYLNEKKESTESHQDSEQEEDFYWEDETDN